MTTSKKRMGASTQRSATGAGQKDSIVPVQEYSSGARNRERVSPGSWSPCVDILESDESYLLHAELPGLSKKDIEITLRDDVLKLSGERRLGAEAREEDFRRRERSYGTFTRAFSLPGESDSSKVEAALKNGILTIRVPKVAEGSPQNVFISDPLSAAEDKILSTGGLDLPPVESEQDDAVEKTIAEYSQLVASSRTTQEAAEHLGVADSRIRQRLAAGTLYGLQRRRKWRLPSFQFTAEGELPHLSKVLPVISRDIHPVALKRWFETPNPDLTDPITDQPLSVRDWLRAGNPPNAVIRMAPYI